MLSVLSVFGSDMGISTQAQLVEKSHNSSGQMMAVSASVDTSRQMMMTASGPIDTSGQVTVIGQQQHAPNQPITGYPSRQIKAETPSSHEAAAWGSGQSYAQRNSLQSVSDKESDVWMGDTYMAQGSISEEVGETIQHLHIADSNQGTGTWPNTNSSS